MKNKNFDWLHRPFLLNEEEMANPAISIANFLRARNLPEHRDLLWSVLQAALVNPKDDFVTADEVSQWVLYFRELEAFIEASFELSRHQTTSL